MNPFRRADVRYGRSPAPETPYQRAAAVWDERIGSARVQARNWRLIALGELAIVGGLTELGEPLLEPLAVALAIAAPRLSITISAGDPLDGARRLALDEHTVHERHIHRSQNRSAEQVATARHRSE